MERIFTSCEICKSCKFYKQLYVKDKTRFRTAVGLCTNKEKSGRNIRSLSLNITHCEFWEQGEDKTVEQKECIREVISDMHTKLTQILEILENEE